ncbi:hypothetical protein [Herbaspirillum sp. C9C3]|uniref:hypothetical protein n=1 Tax=Herbaspirillum sp. C9C3 TaxID=2735271 RepID=UPI0015856671|nr:hypothetical protein [Herbaspirillum sp. C9C3]NUT61140.1 hypothetical protein [Herbaspirillum sp. C9C3]
MFYIVFNLLGALATTSPPLLPPPTPAARSRHWLPHIERTRQRLRARGGLHRPYGRGLHILLCSQRISAPSIKELLALYLHYRGELSVLAQFANQPNSSWFADANAA